MKVGGRRSQGPEMKIQPWMRERLEACQAWTLWASQEVTEVVGIVTEAKSHGGGYGQEWTWRCGAGVLLSSRGCTEIDGSTQQLGDAGSLAGLGGGGLSGGACAGGGGGSCFCTNRLRLCHAATNGRPHPHRSARALGAGGGAGHGRCCALRPSSSRRSAILQRCDAAAGLAASRRRHEEGLSPAALESWTVRRSLIHSFSG